MPFVYIVIENSNQEPDGGGLFPKAYNTFNEAKGAAAKKYRDEIRRQILEIGDASPLKDVDVPESETGFTSLYIEKGIHIYIHKLPVNLSGGNRSVFVKSKTRGSTMKQYKD